MVDKIKVDEKIKRERGERIKILRKQTHLSRRSLGKKHGIASGTLQYWEDGNFGGLSEDGAQKLVNAFMKEGIWVTPEWLLHGTGKEPTVDPYRVAGNNSSLAEEILIREAQQGYNTVTQELKFFLRLHPLAMYGIVDDPAMEPRFVKGEYVAGIQKFEEELSPLIAKDCIVKLKNNETYIRRLVQGHQPGELKLSSINPNVAEDSILIKNSDVLSAAAIIWARREE
jgi:HTH-type transcriptional regulator, cell division transcriptional repressor